jgi:heterodisulfide reductase subunit C
MIKENVRAHQRPEIGLRLSDEIREAVKKCYSCGKCISGCPVASAMDFPPGLMMRWLALGDFKKVLDCGAIWVCSSCQTCYSRCPFKINIPQVIDMLKEYAHLNRLSQKERPIQLFHRTFLAQIKRFGRIHEASFIGEWKILSGKLFNDIFLGMKMFLKGKLSPFPKIIKNRKEIKRWFK